MSEEGPIQVYKDASEIKQDPYPLHKDFEWYLVDVNDEKDVIKINLSWKIHMIYLQTIM